MHRTHLLSRTLVLATLASLAIAQPLFAQPRDNPIERARHHMELGQEAFASGQYEAAVQQFQDAYAASPFPAFLYNAGMAAEKGEDNKLAAEMYRRYLDEEPDASDAAEVEVKIRALLAEAPTEIIAGEESPGVPETAAAMATEMKSLISVRTNPADAKIRILDEKGSEVSSFEGPSAQTVTRGTFTIEASHPDFRTVQTNIHVSPGQVYIVVVEMSQGAFLGFLHIKTDVPGAKVFIDDREEGAVGTTPWGNVLTSGSHKLWIEKPGYETIEGEVEISIGDKERLDFTMTRLQIGVLHVKSNVEGAKVYVDDKLLGQAPFEDTHDPGRHRLKVTAEGMKDYTTEVQVERGKTTKVLVRLNPKPSRTSAWVSAGFAAALFIGGGVAGGIALKIDDDLDKDYNRGLLSDDDPRILKGFLWALGADIAFGVGAIVTGLSVYYFLRDPLPPSEGKIYDPKDLDENPEAENEAKEPETAPAAAMRAPRFVVAPLITPDTAGLGLAVVF